MVESQLANHSVYRLNPVDGLGSIKVMHRNHILPLGQEVRLSADVNWRPAPSPRALGRQKTKERSQTPEDSKDDSSAGVTPGDQCSSDSESEYGHYLEDLIVDNPEENGDQPKQDVTAKEPNLLTNATEVTENADASEILPDVVANEKERGRARMFYNRHSHDGI